MYELFVGAITSQLVVGPTGNMKAAELYAAKVPPTHAYFFTLLWLQALALMLLLREECSCFCVRIEDGWCLGLDLLFKIGCSPLC